MGELYFLHLKRDGGIIFTNPTANRSKKSYSDKICNKIIFSLLNFLNLIFLYIFQQEEITQT